MMNLLRVKRGRVRSALGWNAFRVLQRACRKMPATTPQSEIEITETPLAPRWHTALLVSLIVSVAIAGTNHADARSARRPHAAAEFTHSPALPSEHRDFCGRSRFIVSASAAKKACSATSSGRKWTSARVAFVDIVIGLSFLVFIDASETLYAYVAHVVPNPALAEILPQSLAEKSVWVLFAFSAGLLRRGRLSRLPACTIHWFFSAPFRSASWCKPCSSASLTRIKAWRRRSVSRSTESASASSR